MRGDPQVFSSTDLHTIGDLCQHLLAIGPSPSGIHYVGNSGCGVKSKPTEDGPIINGVPAPGVAWSAYAYVHGVRVDLYGCGPTPRAAVECLARDIDRQIGRLKSAV